MTIYDRLETIANVYGFKLVDNPAMIKHMERRESQHGLMLCPCMFVSMDEDLGSLLSKRCPCEQGLEDIEVHGKCHCGIFERVNG